MNPPTATDPGVELAQRLRLACETHDPAIGPHLDRVTYYSCEIGRRLGLDPGQLDELRLAAPLHDLGKIGLPTALLNKPGRLTAAEIEVVKSHTRLGHKILAGSPWSAIETAAQVALSHHECWDGSGHPHGLAGTDIPLAARIVAVADVYDALLSQRAYKPAWDEEAVSDELRRQRGLKFDPEILDVFLEHLPQIAAR
jgi:HD-GYP domain-containing protein (c-di-GMP phosphodiesterase class II)